MERIIRTMLFAVMIISVSACGNGNNGVANQTEQEEIPSVTVAEVYARDVPQLATYTSTVEPYVKNNIAPQSPVRIVKINVEIGDYVKAGQIVAEMDQIQLQQAELQMKNNEIEYQRLQSLYDAGGLSKSDLDAIELSYKVSKTTYENLLENTILRSPVDGVISARNYDEGDMYSANPIYVVEQITPVKLLVGISESDYTKVKKGDQVDITVDAFPGRTFKGKINMIYPTIDASTHTFTVEIIVPNKDRLLRPGMYARVTVLFGINHNVVVPDEAVVKQTGSGDRFVYILNDDNTVTYQKIIPGRRMNAEYEVLEGLSDSVKVVTEGQIRLKDGIKVTVNE